MQAQRVSGHTNFMDTRSFRMQYMSGCVLALATLLSACGGGASVDTTSLASPSSMQPLVEEMSMGLRNRSGSENRSGQLAVATSPDLAFAFAGSDQCVTAAPAEPGFHSRAGDAAIEGTTTVAVATALLPRPRDELFRDRGREPGVHDELRLSGALWRGWSLDIEDRQWICRMQQQLFRRRSSAWRRQAV